MAYATDGAANARSALGDLTGSEGLGLAVVRRYFGGTSAWIRRKMRVGPTDGIANAKSALGDLIASEGVQVSGSSRPGRSTSVQSAVRPVSWDCSHTTNGGTLTWVNKASSLGDLVASEGVRFGLDRHIGRRLGQGHEWAIGRLNQRWANNNSSLSDFVAMDAGQIGARTEERKKTGVGIRLYASWPERHADSLWPLPRLSLSCTSLRGRRPRPAAERRLLRDARLAQSHPSSFLFAAAGPHRPLLLNGSHPSMRRQHTLGQPRPLSLEYLESSPSSRAAATFALSRRPPFAARSPAIMMPRVS